MEQADCLNYLWGRSVQLGRAEDWRLQEKSLWWDWDSEAGSGTLQDREYTLSGQVNPGTILEKTLLLELWKPKTKIKNL